MIERQMPKYKCHKEVWALKIREINGNSIVPDDDGYGAITLDQAYFDKHKPEPGGYYVVYADGYKSFSPADAFESGYTRLNGNL